MRKWKLYLYHLSFIRYVETNASFRQDDTCKCPRCAVIRCDRITRVCHKISRRNLMFPPRNVRGTGRNKGVAGNHRQLQLVRYTSYLRVLPGFFSVTWNYFNLSFSRKRVMFIVHGMYVQFDGDFGSSKSNRAISGCNFVLHIG